MNQGPRWELLMKKNGGGKSRATVPLTVINQRLETLSLELILGSGYKRCESACVTVLLCTVSASLLSG
jgi:hypothetical protein